MRYSLPLFESSKIYADIFLMLTVRGFPAPSSDWKSSSGFILFFFGAKWQFGKPSQSVSLSVARSFHSDRTVPVINIAPPSRFKLSTFLRASHRRFRSRMQLGTRMQMALQLTNESCRVLIWTVIKKVMEIC